MKKLSSERGSLAGDFYFIQINKAEYIENLISAFAEVGIFRTISTFKCKFFPRLQENSSVLLFLY